VSNLIKRARLAAIKWHGDQVRKYTSEPYWRHPEAVAHLVTLHGGTDEMIAAAWLHDVIEDTMANADDVRRDFGITVASYVVGLTDLYTPHAYPRLNRLERKERERMRLAAQPREIKTIKLADLIDNSKSIRKYDPDFAVTYLAEKRRLLDDALGDGHPDLWHLADKIVREAA